MKIRLEGKYEKQTNLWKWRWRFGQYTKGITDVAGYATELLTEQDGVLLWKFQGIWYFYLGLQSWVFNAKLYNKQVSWANEMLKHY
jgi:hypothetical protein